MPAFRHIEKRQSRQLEDDFPPELFVPWHDLLVWQDLQEGQWTLSPDGELTKRVGPRQVFETPRSVIDGGFPRT